MFVGRRCGGTCDMGASSMKISPSVGDSKPASIRSKVVFPHPDAPSSEKNSPPLMVQLTWSTAFTEPKCFETLLMLINASLLIWAPILLCVCASAPALDPKCKQNNDERNHQDDKRPALEHPAALPGNAAGYT